MNLVLLLLSLLFSAPTNGAGYEDNYDNGNTQDNPTPGKGKGGYFGDKDFIICESINP